MTSNPERILAAALCLERESAATFTLEALVVRAWELFPRHFGLKGYEATYPDTNRAIVLLSGERGMVGRGLLALVAPKTYRLTQLGRSTAEHLEQVEREEAALVSRARAL